MGGVGRLWATGRGALQPARDDWTPARSTEPAGVEEAVAAAGTGPAASPWLLVVFFLSGAAALVYQVVWQRALFAVYGIDIASVTIVVTAFMLGLGVGSLAGGLCSRRAPEAALSLFAASELATGAFGVASLGIFDAVAAVTVGAGHLMTGIVAFLLLLIPTTLMGATLPLLVGHLARRSGNVGWAVGNLYFANTVGAAVGAFAAADQLLGLLGLSGSVHLAAGCNALLGVGVFLLARRERSGA